MMLNPLSNNLLLAYKGPFCIDILSNLGKYIKYTYGVPLETGNKLYKLFFELTQNVAKYSVEVKPIDKYKFSGIGSFSLIENDNNLLLTTSNMIRTKDGSILEKYCDDINKMSRKELLDYRTKTRRKSFGEKDLGAHIGIIQIGILSINKISFEINKIDETYSMFTICASIPK